MIKKLILFLFRRKMLGMLISKNAISFKIPFSRFQKYFVCTPPTFLTKHLNLMLIMIMAIFY